MPVNRCILDELLQADFEACVEAAIERVHRCKPSRVELKQLGLIQKDWRDYIRGFEHIRAKAEYCLIQEYPHYKRMVWQHEALLATKFGVAHSL